MTQSAIHRVGVIGAGQMGGGIAEVCARAGVDVTVFETSEALIDAGRTRLTKSLDRGVSAGRITGAERDGAIGKLRFTTSLTDLADRQLVIEAVIEDEAIKASIFGQLDKIVTDPAAVLQGAERIGTGRLSAYRKAGSTLVVLPPGALGKPVLWYTEVVGVPAGVVARQLEVSNLLARLELVGNLVHVRDLSTVQKRRAAPPVGDGRPDTGSVPGAGAADAKLRPIEVALGSSETGAIIASLPVVGLLPDGSLIVDLTGTFPPTSRPLPAG